MKQIYVGTTEKVNLNVYKDGVLTDADANPGYTISVVGSSAPPRTGTAVQETTGVYYVLTELAESEVEGRIKIEWTYSVASQPGARVDYISVVTPYATLTELIEISPEGTPLIELEHAETFARFMINAYTGRSFGKRYDTINIHGNDKNILVLPHRIERIDRIDVNSEVMYVRNPPVNYLGRNLYITDTNYGIYAQRAEDIPIISGDVTRMAWSKRNRYTVNGIFGWEHVPDEVSYAAKVLADDYFCADIAWKKKYIQQINASDWRVVFNSRQFVGTGNFYVDQILYQFKAIGMVAI